MTELEQRISIAEACGWVWWVFTDRSDKPFYILALATADWPATHGRNGKRCERPNLKEDDCDWTGSPDFPNDLNAIREAVMAQPIGTRMSINDTLMNMLNPREAYLLDRTINATATQRSEAFCRVMWPEKWKK